MSDASLTVLAPMRLEAAAMRRGLTDGLVHRTGIGSRRSRRWRDAELVPAGMDPVAIIGVCGGLDDTLRPGDVIVADEISSADRSIGVRLPGSALLAGELAAMGMQVHRGPIVSTQHPVTGEARARLRDTGALGVDMESAWLVDGLVNQIDQRPVAVIRVVIDTPSHELRSARTVRHLMTARRRLTEIGSVLESWGRAAMTREIVLAGPRSFCAGVDRAIEIVERALDRFGPPVHVRRQIVHNTHVVRDLEAKGAIFVEEVDEVPEGGVLVLAAHGVAPHVRGEADSRRLQVIDATCPLVAKVHSEARRFAARDYDIVLIGHDDHEEVEGTVGEAPARITVVDSEARIDAIEVRNPDRVSFLSQTTLAVDEVERLVARLRVRFPGIVGPRSDDICYATQNRQEAVRAVARECDLMLVVGSANSSNSKRLVEVASRAGCRAELVDDPSDIRLDWLAGAAKIGLTAGASAPESKVEEVVAALGSLGPVTVSERTVREETISFQLPAEVR